MSDMFLPCNFYPDMHIQTTTQICHQLGRQVRFTARVLSDGFLPVFEPDNSAEGTANLIIHMLSVNPKWVHPLPMNVPTLVPESGGVTVTLIEANHCKVLFTLIR